MALFFRGKARKFFLILLGRRRSEKNCAGFGRELSEFSRGWRTASRRRIDMGEAVASKTRGHAGGGPRARRWALAGRAARVRAAERARPHPSDAQRSDWSRMRDVHNAGGRGLRAKRLGVLTGRLHRVSSRVGGRMSTPRSLHGSSECRRSPLKFTARRVDAGGRYPHRRIPARPLRRSLSPVECTDLRVDSAVRYPHRCPRSRCSGAAIRSSRQCRHVRGGLASGASFCADGRPRTSTGAALAFIGTCRRATKRDADPRVDIVAARH